MARPWIAVATLFLLASWAPPVQEDAEFTEKVRALIVRLKDRNNNIKRTAEEDLFQLGLPALPILRAEEAQLASGELKLKIKTIIRRIERVERQKVASGSTLLVSVNAKDKPLPELLAELQKQTRVPIEHKGIPADAVTSLEVKDLSVWEAVDRICSTHGRLAWDVSERGISIRRETYVRPFMAVSSGYLFLLRPFLRYPPGQGTGDRDYLRGEAVVAGPPGSQSVSQHLTYETLADDKGTNLLTAAAGLIQKPPVTEYRILAEPDPARPLFRPVFEKLDAAPARGSAKVKECKGVAIIQVVLEMDRIVEARGPNFKKGGREERSGVSLEIESLDLSGGRLRMQLVVTDTRIAARREERIFYPQTRGKFVLKDAAGKEIAADVTTASTGPTAGSKLGTSETTVFKLQAALPGEAKPDAIELWEPIGVNDVRIPFEFKDVPMKKTK